MRISRRHFLLLALGSSAGAPLCRAARVSVSDALQSYGALRDVLAGMFEHPASARVLGQAYLESRPEESRVDLLARHVLRPFGDPHLLSDAGGCLRIAQRIQDDFRSERVVRVRGWILSETEARLFGLAALLDV